jgi:predicted AAA+ superfamily ATPase
MWAGTGRIVRLPMYGLTKRELHDEVPPQRSPFLVRLAGAGEASTRDEDVDEFFPLPSELPDIDGCVAPALRGAFPELAYRDRTTQDRETWMSSYLDDLLTRDAATVEERKDPVRLRRYFETASLNIAGMPTDLSLYEAAGLNARTAAGYDRLLKSLYVTDHVPAWTSNRLRSRIQARKCYVVDPAPAHARWAAGGRPGGGTVCRPGRRPGVQGRVRAGRAGRQAPAPARRRDGDQLHRGRRDPQRKPGVPAG